MIRLIATDMDGTLLDSKKQLPPDFDVVMRKLYERDILFAVASGRSYATLKKQFEDYLDDIVFICDNGANVVYQQESVSVSLLAWELVEEIVEQVRRGGGKMLLCGKHGTYHEYFGSTEAEDEIASYYVNQVIVDNVLDVKDEIFKIAVFDEQNMEQTLSQMQANDLVGKQVRLLVTGASTGTTSYVTGQVLGVSGGFCI